MNGLNLSKNSTMLKENCVAEKHEGSKCGDQKKGSVFFTHYQEYGRGFASAFCAWGGKLCVSLQYTPPWQIACCEGVLQPHHCVTSHTFYHPTHIHRSTSI